MLPYRDSRLTKIVVILFFLIVVGYAYYEARGILFGPSITLAADTPATTQSSYVLITGRAAHIESLSADGEPLQVTEAGAFKEPYVLAPGVNRIVFDAVDKYGHATQKIVEIVYLPSATSSLQTIGPTASSAATTSIDGAASSSATVAPLR